MQILQTVPLRKRRIRTSLYSKSKYTTQNLALQQINDPYHSIYYTPISILTQYQLYLKESLYKLTAFLNSQITCQTLCVCIYIFIFTFLKEGLELSPDSPRCWWPQMLKNYFRLWTCTSSGPEELCICVMLARTQWGVLVPKLFLLRLCKSLNF